MLINRFKILVSMASIGLLMLFSSMAWAQGEPSACVELGANVYQNWTKDDSGGSGMPTAEASGDYLRCKACHGWDLMGTDGGYVRRSRNDGRPNAGAGDGDSTSRAISPIMGGYGPITADMITHSGAGRAYADGSGSWVPLADPSSAANTAAPAGGYTLGNQHPDLALDGANAADTVLTQEQVDCVVEFLNFPGTDPSAYFANINPTQDPVLYTIVDTADAAAGEAFYGTNCTTCHSADPADDSGFDPDGGMLAYLAKDGKFSEFSHKARWGVPDEIMTREAIGSPTAADVANMMLWMQELGGTGFAANPGLSGTWWNAARSGEGFVLEFGFSNGVLTLFASFYTYLEGEQMWLTAESTAIDGSEVAVDVFITNGGMWGDDFDSADVNLIPWGTGTFSFPGCSAGTVALAPNGDMQAIGFTDLTYGLTRDLMVSGIACPTPTG